jgi:hypothetical protein
MKTLQIYYQELLQSLSWHHNSHKFISNQNPISIPTPTTQKFLQNKNYHSNPDFPNYDNHNSLILLVIVEVQ